MRLTALLLMAMLPASSLAAQQTPRPRPSSPPDSSSPAQDAQGQTRAKDQKPIQNQGTQDHEPTQDPEPSTKDHDLPVSLDRIKHALEQTPVQTLRGLDEKPNFKIEVREHQKFTLEDLIKSMDFKPGPVPGGGLYGFEQQRQMWPAVDNPLRQPYAAFNQGELLTILIENLVGKYLAGKAGDAISKAERARAEAQAKEEVHAAVAEYCNAQPNAGIGLQICSSLGR